MESMERVMEKKMTEIWVYVDAEARMGGYPKIAGMPRQPSHASDPSSKLHMAYIPNVVVTGLYVTDIFPTTTNTSHLGMAMMSVMHVLKAAYESGLRGASVLTTEHKVFNDKPCDILVTQMLDAPVYRSAYQILGLTKKQLVKCIVCCMHFRDTGRSSFVVFPKDPAFFEMYDKKIMHNMYAQHPIIKMDDLQPAELEAIMSYKKDACAACHGPMPARQFCGVCRRARYCGKECQRAAWKDHHRAICPHLKALGR